MPEAAVLVREPGLHQWVLLLQGRQVFLYFWEYSDTASSGLIWLPVDVSMSNG